MAGIRSHKRNTVFETLVIIILVVIVAVIMYPVLFPSQSTHVASCQANMKRLYGALSSYCRDYDGNLPSTAILHRGNKWHPGWYRRFATTRGFIPPEKPKEVTLTLLLYPYLSEKSSFWCLRKPRQFLTFSLNDKVGKIPSERKNIISYWYKAAVDRAWFGGMDEKGRKWSCRSMDDYGSPANQIVFYERADYHVGQPDTGLVDGVTLNCVFMDGHVAASTLVSAGNKDGGFNPKAPGEPAWYNYDTVSGKYIAPTVCFDPRIHCDKFK